MVSSLIEHERIVTTNAKAKELRHLADRMITLAKKGQPETSASVDDSNTNTDADDARAHAHASTKTPGELLHHRRRASRIVRGEWNVTKLFEVLGPRYKFREGGYTRIMKLARPRAGDNAPMAVIEYVDRPGEIRAARPPSKIARNDRKTSASASTNTNGVEDALRKMGIAPVDELVSSEEKESIQEELNKVNHDEDDDDDDDADDDSTSASTK